MSAKIRTRVLLLSDTHSALPRPGRFHDAFYRQPLPEADVIIHSGDLTMTGKLEEHLHAVSLLKSIRAPLKIVIPGNHDLTLDREYYDTRRARGAPNTKYTAAELDQIQGLYTGNEAQSHGIHYMVEGVRTFKLANGATLNVYASAFTPEFCGWAFAYPRSRDRFNSKDAENPIPSFVNPQDGAHIGAITSSNIDVLITHGPPKTILDQTPRGDSVGCSYLMTAVKRCRPLIHCFGHIHEGWGAIMRTWNDASPQPQPDHTASEEGTREDSPKTTTPRTASTPHYWQSSQDPNQKSFVVDHTAALNDMGVTLDATDLRRGRETLFVNASIMSLEYEPTQAPWIVDLLLEKHRESDRSRSV